MVLSIVYPPKDAKDAKDATTSPAIELVPPEERGMRSPLVQSVSLTGAFPQYRGRLRPRRRCLHDLDAPEIEGVLVERLPPLADP
jgi:hypothetical protein